jgi:Domain of unknown function (DUF305)
MRRLLLALLLGACLTACGGEDGDGGSGAADGPTDAEFTTELLHRDAALLNLLDVSLGRDLDPTLAATGEQQRLDANERMATGFALLEEWGEEIPATSRDHGAEHGSDGDVPVIDGMPTGEDLRALGRLQGQAFVDEYVALLASALESTRAFAEDHEGREAAADQLAKAAVASSQTALDAL